MFVLLLSLRWVLKVNAQDGIMQGNIYTANHYKYNQMCIDYVVVFCLLVCLLFILKENPVWSGGDNSNSCWKKMVRGLFVVLRSIAVIYFICWVIIDLIRIDIFTITIIWQNWWRNSKENFRTNVSWLNAMICWILWLLVIGSIIF